MLYDRDTEISTMNSLRLLICKRYKCSYGYTFMIVE